jgi:hypothetical protein
MVMRSRAWLAVLPAVAFATVTLDVRAAGRLDKTMFATYAAQSIRACGNTEPAGVLVIADDAGVADAESFARALGSQLGQTVMVVPFAKAPPYRPDLEKKLDDAARTRGAAAVAILYELPPDFVRIAVAAAEARNQVTISTTEEDLDVVAFAFDRGTNKKMFYSKRALAALGRRIDTRSFVAYRPAGEERTVQEAYDAAVAGIQATRDAAALWDIVRALRKAIAFHYKEEPLNLTWRDPFFPHYQLGRAFHYLHKCEAAVVEWEISQQQKMVNKLAIGDMVSLRRACTSMGSASLHDIRDDVVRGIDADRELLLPPMQTLFVADRRLAGGSTSCVPDLERVLPPHDEAVPRLVERDRLHLRFAAGTERGHAER